MTDEKKLIEEIIRGEERSFDKILNLYKGRIFGYVLRLVKNYDDAEEITFDVFIKFYKTIRTFDTTKPIINFLFAIAHNLVIDFFRKNSIGYEYLDERHSTSDDFFERLEKEKRLNAIEKALQELNPIDREIVILFHKEELSYEEISKILNLPITTIKTRLHRARDRIRKNIKHYLKE